MTKKSLRILVTNDDGIHAPGLAVLEKIAREITDDLWVVAPETEQSGAAHSITLHLPLRVREVERKRFAVAGTPTDCVLLAVQALLPPKKQFDLVLSGVNRGWNVAEDITYSGTVAAAMEGTLMEIPSIAFSQSYEDGKKIRWEVAAANGARVVQKILKAGIPPYVLMNVNFPDVALAKVKAVTLCPQGIRRSFGKLTKRTDPRGRDYYWVHGLNRDHSLPAETDMAKLLAGHITVTPIRLDLTDHALLKSMQVGYAT